MEMESRGVLRARAVQRRQRGFRQQRGLGAPAPPLRHPRARPADPTEHAANADGASRWPDQVRPWRNREGDARAWAVPAPCQER